MTSDFLHSKYCKYRIIFPELVVTDGFFMFLGCGSSAGFVLFAWARMLNDLDNFIAP